MFTPDISLEIHAFSLPIVGEIPDWLNGTFVRNHPVRITKDGKPVGHWFDGPAMLHALSFDEGRVHYSNKFIHSEIYDLLFKKHSLDYPGFAQNRDQCAFKKLLSFFFPSSIQTIQNTNVNLTKIAERHVALTEVPLPVEFNIKTLETLGVLPYEDPFPKRQSFESAHPHYNQETGELISFFIEFGYQTTYNVYRIKKDQLTREIIAKIPVKEPAYMHSFALTENYIILTEFPFRARPIDFILQARPFIFNFNWKPESGTQFIIIDRHQGEILGQFSTKAFFAFHHANAFEKEGELFLDIITYPDAGVIRDLYAYGLPFNEEEFKSKSERYFTQTQLVRFKVSLENKNIDSEVILKTPLEFPRHHEKLDGKPYRYLYAIDPRDFIPGDLVAGDLRQINDKRALYKIDLNSKDFLIWHEVDCYPSEPLFIPSPHASDEDAGVILTLVYHAIEQNSFLLVLDAKTFQELGRAKIPQKINASLHGQFF
jgi:beta,beta-carotene 9',10'-dioxygenase